MVFWVADTDEPGFNRDAYIESLRYQHAVVKAYEKLEPCPVKREDVECWNCWDSGLVDDHFCWENCEASEALARRMAA